MNKKYFILPLGGRGSGGGGTAVVVDELPAVEEAKANVIYMIVKEDAEEQDYYDEWMVVEKDGVKQWEKIGNTKIDLSDYYTKEQIDAKLDDVWDFYEHTQDENKEIYDAIANGQPLPYKYFQISDSEPKKYVGTYSTYDIDYGYVDFFNDVKYTWEGSYTKIEPWGYSLQNNGMFVKRGSNFPAIDIEKFPLKTDIKDSTITIKQGGVEQSFTLNQSGDKVIELQQGGGGNEWFGTEEEFKALGEYDESGNTLYHIEGKIDYNSDIKNLPLIAKKVSQLPNDAHYVQDVKKINGISMRGKGDIDIMKIIERYHWWGTQEEYDAIEAKDPNVQYHIEGNTTTLTFELEDGTTQNFKVINE